MYSLLLIHVCHFSRHRTNGTSIFHLLLFLLPLLTFLCLLDKGSCLRDGVGVHFNVVVAHLLIRVLGALCSDLVLPLNRIVINRIKTFVVFVRIRGILWLVVVCC